MKRFPLLYFPLIKYIKKSCTPWGAWKEAIQISKSSRRRRQERRTRWATITDRSSRLITDRSAPTSTLLPQRYTYSERGKKNRSNGSTFELLTWLTRRQNRRKLDWPPVVSMTEWCLAWNPLAFFFSLYFWLIFFLILNPLFLLSMQKQKACATMHREMHYQGNYNVDLMNHSTSKNFFFLLFSHSQHVLATVRRAPLINPRLYKYKKWLPEKKKKKIRRNSVLFL